MKLSAPQRLLLEWHARLLLATSQDFVHVVCLGNRHARMKNTHLQELIMKRLNLGVLLATLLVIGLAGCKNMGLGGADIAATTASNTGDAAMTGDLSKPSTNAVNTASMGSSGPAGSSGSSGSSGTGAGAGAGAGATGQVGTPPSSSMGAQGSAQTTQGPVMGATSPAVAMATLNSTVINIETAPNTATGNATDAHRSRAAGASAVGGSTSSGATGSSPSAERMYRVTVRTDDGRTHVITQDWAPSFSTGDRVRMENGAIAR